MSLSRLSSLPRPHRIALTLLVALLAALACEALHTPLPWMIGPLLATALGGMRGAPFAAAAPLRNAGQWAIGTALGLYFTPEVVATVTRHAGAIAAGVAWAVVMGALYSAFLQACNRQLGRLDPATAFFSGAIGGASEMTLLAERHGARTDLVAAAHSMRLLVVVIVVPFGLQFAGIHGADAFVPGPREVQAGGLLVLVALTSALSLLLERRRLPIPWVMGSLAVAGALTASGIELSALPRWMTNLGQLFLGVAIGVRFTPAFVHTAPRWLASAALGSLGLLAGSALFAWALAAWSGLHPATVLLGTSPGGMAEMCITAKVLELGVPLVTAFHVTRLVAVVLMAGPLFGWLARRRRAAQA